MPKRDDHLLLQDIHEAGLKIISFTSTYTFEEYLNDIRTIDAVIRNFEVIGEASRLLSTALKKQHTNLDWRKIIAFRNLLIHDYFGINHLLVWEVIQDDLPKTMMSIEQILSNYLE